MRALFLLVFLSVSASAQAQHELFFDAPSPEAEELQRALASTNNEASAIYYLSYKGPADKNVTVEAVTPERWQNKFSAGGRYDYLMKFYFANTRDISNSGLRHAACFTGNPLEIAQKYFADSVEIRDLVGRLRVAPSADSFLMGIQFAVKDKNKNTEIDAHFRLPHCSNSGKAEIIAEALRKNALNKAGREPQSKGISRGPASAEEEQGFKILDQVKGLVPANLPKFTLKSDYENARPAANERPWQGMDITTEAGAFKFAELVQAHFYEGMANQDAKNPDNNFIAQNARNRFWCHMPWQNLGPSGREAIHGLTMERDLQPSTMYPNATPGSDWGVAVYNAKGCEAIGAVFGSPSKGLQVPPAWDKARFADGSMAVKILFTTADFPDLAGAYTWTANVSPPKSTSRKLQKVRHLQMDIAVMDSTLKGVKNHYRNWVMTTYYYDTKYQAPTDSPLRKIRGLPVALLKMRPIGVQTGFEAPNGKADSDSIIFAGAKTNQSGGRLNGPADNPKSSCLSCHGTAGTKVAMSPGFMSLADWNKSGFQSSSAKHLDFSQQFGLAKRNYETRFKAK